MSERTYYVLCEDNCKFESMTKEQILAAITQAVEGHDITNVDTGFVTKLKEQNHQAAFKTWVGTYAEYNAIVTKENNCLYLITDDSAESEIYAAIDDVSAEVEAIADRAEPNFELWSGAINADTSEAQTANGISEYSMFAILLSAEATNITESTSAMVIAYKFNTTGGMPTVKGSYINDSGSKFGVKLSLANNAWTLNSATFSANPYTSSSNLYVRKIIGLM